MSYYERFNRINNVYGDTLAKESTEKGRLDFKYMLENDLSPTVYEVDLSVNKREGLEDSKKVKVDVGNVSNNDQREFDEKYIKFTYDEDVSLGSQVKWKDKDWLIVHEEEMAYDIYNSFTMKRCNNVLSFKLGEERYDIPIVVRNLTLYSDGMSDMVYISTQDGKRNILLPENDITKNIKIDTRVMLTNETAYRITHIDNFTRKGIRNLTAIQVEVNSLDDLENNIAYNKDLLDKKIDASSIIQGEDILYIGSFNDYTVDGFKDTYKWEIEGLSDSLIITTDKGKCSIECDIDSDLIGETFKIKILDGEKVIEEKCIEIRGLC